MATQRTRIKLPWHVGPDPTAKNMLGIQENFERLAEAIHIPEEEEPEPLYTPPEIEPYTQPALNATKSWYSMHSIGTGVQMEGASPVSSGITTGGTGAARASPPFADSPYLQIPGIVLNGTATVFCPVGTNVPHDLIWDFDCSFVIRTFSDIGGRHILGVSQGLANADAPAEAGCFFRYSTSATDGGWRAFCHDGTTQSARSGIISPIAISTRYLLRIRKVSGVAFFSINGGPETAINTNVPVLTRTGVGPKYRVTNLGGGLSTLYFSRAWCVFGT
jgi:hypothetical protein